MYVNANPAPGPMTLNPYTQKTAQQSFDVSVNGNAQQASKIKLWAIRIFSDIASVLTQPAVTSLTGLAFCVAVLFIPVVNTAVFVATVALSIVSIAANIFKLLELVKNNSGQLSEFFAAKAELAKIEINNRQAQLVGHGHAVANQS